jgi:hypothetical protein
MAAAILAVHSASSGNDMCNACRVRPAPAGCPTGMVNNQIRESTIMKTPVTAADLWVLLDREFRRRRPRECDACFVPLPFRVDTADGAPNWEVDIRSCGKRCEFILEELVQELQRRHDLASD